MKNVPSSPELEEALLGSLLLNPDLVLTVGVEPSDFYVHRNRWIFEAIRELVEGKQNVDSLTLSTHLESMGKLNEVGGPVYLTELLLSVPTSINAETYAAQIRQYTVRRRMIEAANHLAVAAYDKNVDPSQAIANAQDELTGVNPRAKGATHIFEHHLKAKEEIERRAGQDADRFSLRFPLADLTANIGRLYPDDGTVFLLVGKPGLGKTILLSDIARHFAIQTPGAYYSLEMSSFRLMLREYSARTGLLVSDMKRGKVDAARLDQMDETMSKMQVYLDTSTGWTTNSLRADLFRLKRERGIRWYCFDYMGLLQDEVRGEEHDRTREISRRIMQINRDLRLACVMVHTLTKGGEVAGSAGVAYDADIIGQLVRPKMAASTPRYKPVELYITKNRDQEGPNGKATIGLLNSKPQFISLMTEEEELQWYQK